jgi:DNA-binding GntR family transcriptional regulator
MDELCDKQHRQCVRDRLHAEIVRRVLDGRYPPGTHLKELVLAREFGCSQAPVREALRELEMLGLVVSERYCGTRVLPIASADLREAYEFKAIIEERSAQLATACRPADLDALADNVAVMTAAAARAEAESYSAAAIAFHRRIVAMSGNKQFLRAWEAMHWEVRTRIAAERHLAQLPNGAVAHGQILAALRAGDGAEAGRLLRALIEDFLRWLKEHP